jgi:predicted metal-binding protein
MSVNEINSEETGWNEAVVMICSKCAREAEGLKSELKTICKDRLGKDVRVINTGCLNICPENKIAVTVASRKDDEVFRSYSVPKDVAAEKLFDELF